MKKYMAAFLTVLLSTSTSYCMEIDPLGDATPYQSEKIASFEVSFSPEKVFHSLLIADASLFAAHLYTFLSSSNKIEQANGIGGMLFTALCAKIFLDKLNSLKPSHTFKARLDIEA